MDDVMLSIAANGIRRAHLVDPGFKIALTEHKAWQGVQVKKTRPWIIAHRGARNEAPENTGSALRRAAEYPIDGVEFDVQMSSDGERSCITTVRC